MQMLRLTSEKQPQQTVIHNDDEISRRYTHIHTHIHTVHTKTQYSTHSILATVLTTH